MSKLIPKSGAWIHITADIHIDIPVHQFALYYATPTGTKFFKDENTVRGGQIFMNGMHPYTHEEFREYLPAFKTPENFKNKISDWKRNTKAEFSNREKNVLEIIERECGPVHEVFPVEDQVEIHTELGRAVIQPHEYTLADQAMIDQYIASSGDGHAVMNYLSDNTQLKGKVAEQVFYLRSRGIPYHEAVKLCIGNVKSKNLFYIYGHPAYCQNFNHNFDQYVKRHVGLLREAGEAKKAAEYMMLVRQIEGYENFTV